VEAQSQKLPVISSPISGIPELIEHDKNGLLVEPNQPSLLANALEQLARNPASRQQMGEDGMARVHKNFNAKNEISLLLELLNSNG